MYTIKIGNEEIRFDEVKTLEAIAKDYQNINTPLIVAALVDNKLRELSYHLVVNIYIH